MALPKYRKKLDIGGGGLKPTVTPTINNDTTYQTGNVSLNQYANAYNQNNKPTQNPYAGGVLNTPNKTIVNEANVNNNVATSGIENKQIVENKPTVDIIPQQSNNVIEETKPLQNAYDSYKAQLELDKLSAQNEVASANKVAQQYMDNYLKYYGMQGSGMGQSAYANLAAQQTQQLADVNRQYSRDLADYRDSFNQNLKDQAALDLQSLSKEDQQSYINKLRGQSGVNDDTIANIESRANSINYQRDEEAKAEAESERNQANSDALADGQVFAQTYNDQKWNSYLERLKSEGVDEKVITRLQNYRDAYGYNTFENSYDNAVNTVAGMIDSAKENKDYNKLNDLNAIYTEISNAETPEQLEAALAKLEQNETKGYGSKTYEDVGAKSGAGTKEDPYVFGESKSDLKELAEEGKLPEGTWVQYKNVWGNWVMRQVQDGKLKDKERVDDYVEPESNSVGKGTEEEPYTASSKDELEKMISNGEALTGDYYYITDENGKKVRYRIAETAWGYKYLKED